MPVVIAIDDYLPFIASNDIYTLYGQRGDDSSIWGPLLEKAIAKFVGSYDLISGGFETEAFSFLLGAPSKFYYLPDLTGEEIWDIMSIADARDSMMTTGTFYGTGSD